MAKTLSESNESASATGVKEKLINLRKYLPNEDNKMLYEFAQFLSQYANDEILPEGLDMIIEIALYDSNAKMGNS